MSAGIAALRLRLGALLFDRPRFAWPLFLPGAARSRWLEFRNRRETIVPAADARSFDCDWRWTSDLHAAKAFPGLGGRLLRRALREWPVEFADARTGRDGSVVSFVVGHRGLDRLPLLRTTLRTLFAQRDVPCEYIVVEQDVSPRIRASLPEGVRHVFDRVPAGTPYCRSRAFNAGAQASRGRFLVFHDNDTLAPADYAREVVRLGNRGFRAMRLQRFVFYLDARTSDELVLRRCLPERIGTERIAQNSEGVTIAVERAAFSAIGGFDETFVGWGGEDNEFFDRCRTLPGYFSMYLPFVHLFHAPQPGKQAPWESRRHFDETLRLPAADRIARLRDAGATAAK